MKRILYLIAILSLIASQAFATYIVVLTNGTRYKAKSKWTVVNGKALINLETGQTLQIDPALIDVARSEQTTKLGLGDVNIINIDQAPTTTGDSKESTLGSSVKLRKPVAAPDAAPTRGASSPVPPLPASASGAGLLPQDVVDKFARAYENVGIFEQKLTATGPHSIRAELTADSEVKVFNAISATSFLVVRNAGVPGTQVDVVELFMKTTTGGSAGRFQMSRDDAEQIDSKKLTQQEYFIRKVIF